MRAAPLRPRGARPPSPGLPRRAVSAAPGGGGRDGEGPRSPAARGRGCRWRGQVGHEPTARPVGAGRAVFGNRCAFCFVLSLSVVASSARVRERGAPGRASDTCEEAATACGAPAPDRAGNLKFKCDPRQGRELATAREGPRAQEAGAFKGPARPGLARLRARLPS